MDIENNFVKTPKNLKSECEIPLEVFPRIAQVKAMAFDELCDILAEGGDPESLPKEKIKMIIGLVYTVEQTIDGMTHDPGDC